MDDIEIELNDSDDSSDSDSSNDESSDCDEHSLSSNYNEYSDNVETTLTKMFVHDTCV